MEFLTNLSGSGFGFDTTKSGVTAETPVWDTFLEVSSQSNKSFKSQPLISRGSVRILRNGNESPCFGSMTWMKCLVIDWQLERTVGLGVRMRMHHMRRITTKTRATLRNSYKAIVPLFHQSHLHQCHGPHTITTKRMRTLMLIQRTLTARLGQKRTKGACFSEGLRVVRVLYSTTFLGLATVFIYCVLVFLQHQHPASLVQFCRDVLLP